MTPGNGYNGRKDLHGLMEEERMMSAALQAGAMHHVVCSAKEKPSTVAHSWALSLSQGCPQGKTV